MMRVAPTPRRLVLAFGLCALVCATVPDARAESPLAGQPAIRNKLLLFEGRHVITPTFGATVGDTYTTNLLAGLGWRYFFENWVGIGIDVLAGGGVETSLASQLNDELSTSDNPFELSTSSLQLLATLGIEFVPFVGKFMLFGEGFARIDVHVDVAAGVAMAAGSGRIEDTFSFTPMVGMGMRLFPSDWISVGFDVRSYLVSRTLAARRDGSVPPAEYGLNWFVGAQIGIFLPGEPEIER